MYTMFQIFFFSSCITHPSFTIYNHIFFYVYFDLGTENGIYERKKIISVNDILILVLIKRRKRTGEGGAAAAVKKTNCRERNAVPKKNNGWHEKYVFVQMKLRKMNCRQFVVLIGSDVVVLLLPMWRKKAVQEWKEKCNFNVLYPFWAVTVGMDSSVRSERVGGGHKCATSENMTGAEVRRQLGLCATFYSVF